MVARVTKCSPLPRLPEVDGWLIAVVSSDNGRFAVAVPHEDSEVSNRVEMLLKRLAQKRLPIQQTGHQVTALHSGRGVSLINKAGHWDDLTFPQSRAAAFPALVIAATCTAGPSTGRTMMLTLFI
ncbi:hypothetical protein CMUS01_05248 [Colletotrichum musicola]|uniref:Uncharacterized protein n=1 Tax=Colletotrichum musicola TaxID=2175873 RepID=A0A8H6NLD0_9PEZI|nr:hypothetical protein CMUS01_05248 [Colletotrichum musicola]